LEEAGLAHDPAALIAPRPVRRARWAAALARLLETVRPTAVICSSDLMALGAISEAQKRGLAVPRDLSVVGFDDIRSPRTARRR